MRRTIGIITLLMVTLIGILVSIYLCQLIEESTKKIETNKYNCEAARLNMETEKIRFENEKLRTEIFRRLK